MKPTAALLLVVGVVAGAGLGWLAFLRQRDGELALEHRGVAQPGNTPATERDAGWEARWAAFEERLAALERQIVARDAGSTRQALPAAQAPAAADDPQRLQALEDELRRLRADLGGLLPGDMPSDAEDLLKAIRRAPFNADDPRQVADALLAQRRIPYAVRFLEQFPHHESAANVLGQLMRDYMLRGQQQEAAAAFARLQPALARAVPAWRLDAIGEWVLEANGRAEEALQANARIVASADAEPWARANALVRLGHVYENQKRWADARLAWQHVVDQFASAGDVYLQRQVSNARDALQRLAGR